MSAEAFPEESPELPAGTSEEYTKLERIARESGFALRDTTLWLHRRVERITYTDRLIFQRRVSVDFTIPERLPPFATRPDSRSVYFVPIALVRKWPPVMQWDLRDEHDTPLPLLTSGKNRRVDGEALVGLAPPGKLRDCVEPLLRAVPREPWHIARNVLSQLGGVLNQWEPQMDDEDFADWFRASEVAAMMVTSSVLWARVVAYPGQRQIVKFSYEEPVEPDLVLRRRLVSAFSWASIRTFFVLPNFGERASYHLEVSPPIGLEVNRVFPLALDRAPPRPGPAQPMPKRLTALRVTRAPYVVLRQLARGLRQKSSDTFRTARATDDPVPPRHLFEPAPGSIYQWNARERAYIYASVTMNQFATARVDFAVTNRVLVRSSLLASLLITALLWICAVLADIVASHANLAATVLLIVPGLLGYLVVRPGEHPLVSRHLIGVRLLALLAGGLPVAAAILLLVHRTDRVLSSGRVVPVVPDVGLWWTWLAVAATVTTLLLGASWLLPVRDES